MFRRQTRLRNDIDRGIGRKCCVKLEPLLRLFAATQCPESLHATTLALLDNQKDVVLVLASAVTNRDCWMAGQLPDRPAIPRCIGCFI
jgi:hypothetical protein